MDNDVRTTTSAAGAPSEGTASRGEGAAALDAASRSEHAREDGPQAKAPVLVLGNGPVGQTAALLLARWGVPVILLDRRPERDPIGSKALCQQRDVLDIWAHIGAGDQIAREGLTWDRAVTFYGDQELFRHGFVDAGSSPYPPFVNIGQNRTEQILDERIAAQPLIDVRWGHHIESLEQTGDGVELVCSVERPGAACAVERVHGSYAIACPGARGDSLRAKLGLSFDGITFSDQFLICDIRTTLPGWEHERRFYFDPEWNPGRQVLIHPCPDSTYRIDWQVPPDYDLAAEEASGALEKRIRKIIGDADYEIVWKSVYRFHARRVDRMRVGRVLVAGDAAHLVSPFGARGLNSGVPDAENAAWKLAYCWHGWAHESLLESYHDERLAAAEENLAVTSATMDFLVPQDEAAWQRRRDILTAAGTDPRARARVDSGRLAEAFWYVDSPLTTPDPTRPFAGRPPKGEAPTPAPGIVAPDVPITGSDGASRLRAILRDGVTVLLADGADADGADADGVRAVVEEGAGGSPVQALAMSALGDGVAEALRARPGEAWIVRPDAYVAAVVPDATPQSVATAVRRLWAPAPASC